MPPSWSLIVALAPSLGLHLANHPDVALERALSVVEALRDAIEDRGTATRVDDGLWEPCDGSAACADAIRARLETDAVAFVSVFEGVQTIRVVAMLDGQTHRVEISRDQTSWSQELLPLAEALAPRAASSSAKTASVAAAPSTSVPWLPLAIGAGSLVAAGTGIGFGLSARAAGDDLRAGPLPSARADTLLDRQHGHAWAANVLITASVAAAATAIVLFVTD